MVALLADDRFEPLEAPFRYEAGTPNIEGVIGLGAAVDYLLKIGMATIAAHSRALAAQLIEGLTSLPQATVLGRSVRDRIALATVSLPWPAMRQQDIARLLADAHAIFVSGGFHCAHVLHHRLQLDGTLRASAHIYNDAGDIDAFIKALARRWSQRQQRRTNRRLNGRDCGEVSTMRIDLVSDVVCPWCAIGVSALERALERIGDDLGSIELHVQPFELNPTMPPEGADVAEYLSEKYGLSPEQLQANRERIVERGAAEGFAFGTRMHIWNTFDAHRLLFWAGAEGPDGAQRALKRALLAAYHGEGRNVSAHDVLIDARREGRSTGRARARGARSAASSPTRCAKPSGSGRKSAFIRCRP